MPSGGAAQNMSSSGGGGLSDPFVPPRFRTAAVGPPGAALIYGNLPRAAPHFLISIVHASCQLHQAPGPETGAAQG